MADSPKQRAALQAAQEVQPGTQIGLGSGSTVNLITAALGDRLRHGALHDIAVVVASRRTEAAAREAGLTITTLEATPELALAMDGADEIDPRRNMIKGGGGALLRERIVLGAARQRLIVGDESKLVQTLGERWALPVEVVQFGWKVADAALRRLGVEPRLRMQGGAVFVTDEGNYILDCPFGLIHDPVALDRELRTLPGVMDHGLFLGLADRILVGTGHDVHEL